MNLKDLIAKGDIRTESGKLPEVHHLRGLGDPMFFRFNIDPKNRILVAHAAIMGTFILHPEAEMKLCTIKDDPRLPHFAVYMMDNGIMTQAERLGQLTAMIKQAKEELKQIMEEIDKLKNKPA